VGRAREDERLMKAGLTSVRFFVGGLAFAAMAGACASGPPRDPKWPLDCRPGSVEDLDRSFEPGWHEVSSIHFVYDAKDGFPVAAVELLMMGSDIQRERCVAGPAVLPLHDQCWDPRALDCPRPAVAQAGRARTASSLLVSPQYAANE
jgi:hypothetical protein